MMAGVMLDLYEEFRGVVRALEDAGIPYAVCGGLALAIHVQPRATVDIDLLIPEDAIAAALSALKPLAFEERSLPMTFGKVRIRRLTKLEPAGTDTLILDLLIARGETLTQTWENRVVVPWEDGAVSVVSREGLISMKRLRGSPQDLVDIESLGRPEETA